MTFPFPIRRMPRRLLAVTVGLVVVASTTLAATQSDAAAPPRTNLLEAGQGLTPGQAIYSDVNQFSLVMQSDGNLVDYGNGRALWQTGTSGVGNHVILQTDGNLVLYSSKGKALWQSGTRGPGALFSIGECGDLVLYATNYWEERPSGCDTGTTGDVMTANQQLAHQGAWVTLQADGNLVDTYLNHVLWSSHTSGNPGDTLHIQKDGNVVIYSAKGKALWSTGTAGAGASIQFSVSGQGILKVVKAGKVIWQAG